MVCSYLTELFDLHYWYTRVTSVGISRSAALLRIVITLSNTGAWLLESPIVLGARLISFRGFMNLILTLLITKTLVGLELTWLPKTSWIPIIRRVRPSHKERASARIDAQTSWRVKGSVSNAIIRSSATEYICLIDFTLLVCVLPFCRPQHYPPHHVFA
jgi:hypothetical protein